MSTGRSNEAAPNASRPTSQTVVEPDAVGRPGDDDADPAALVQRAAHAVGQPEDSVDQHAARGTGPVPRSGGGRGYHHLRILEARQPELNGDGHKLKP